MDSIINFVNAIDSIPKAIVAGCIVLGVCYILGKVFG